MTATSVPPRGTTARSAERFCGPAPYGSGTTSTSRRGPREDGVPELPVRGGRERDPHAEALRQPRRGVRARAHDPATRHLLEEHDVGAGALERPCDRLEPDLAGRRHRVVEVPGHDDALALAAGGLGGDRLRAHVPRDGERRPHDDEAERRGDDGAPGPAAGARTRRAPDAVATTRDAGSTRRRPATPSTAAVATSTSPLCTPRGTS